MEMTKKEYEKIMKVFYGNLGDRLFDILMKYDKNLKNLKSLKKRDIYEVEYTLVTSGEVLASALKKIRNKEKFERVFEDTDKGGIIKVK
jgi:hypothetical protein